MVRFRQTLAILIHNGKKGDIVHCVL